MLLGSGAVQGAQYEWTFSQGNLTPALGNGTMAYADAATGGLTTFGNSDGATVPHINGQPASFLHAPGFALGGNGYNLTFASTGPNGGGAYVNQYSFVFDIMLPGAGGWSALFNTDPGNGNDADFYVAPDGSLGIGDLGYSPVGTIANNTWYRIGFTADLGAGQVSYYVNGLPVLNRTGGSLLEGRFALYSNADAGPDVRFLNEGDGSGVYTHESYLSSLYFTDTTLSAAQMAALGGPNAFGIVAVPEPGVWALLGLGLLALVWGRRGGKY